MSIKEQIEKLPDGVEVTLMLQTNGSGSPIAEQLKALAASHTKLIRQLRVMTSAAEHKGTLLPESFKIAWEVIEEAEKI